MKLLRLRLSAAIIALSAAWPAGADDYQSLLQRAERDGGVEVLAGEWQAVTGEISPADLADVVSGGTDRQSEMRALMAAISRQGGTAREIRRYRYLPVSALKVDRKALEAMRAHSGALKIFGNGRNRISLAKSAPATGMDKFWRRGFDGKGQMVAVLDTGVDADHPFLKGRVVHEACFSQSSCPDGSNRMSGPGAARPLHGHGTHVAGIIAGQADDFSGIAPQSDIIGINVFSTDGKNVGAADSDVMAGLDHVLALIIEKKLPVAAVNMSLGGGEHRIHPCDDSPYQQAARIFESLGVALVAASGNESSKSGLPSPACASAVISVGAHDLSGKVPAFSNSSDYLDVLAPGVNITSASVDASGRRVFEAQSGTSMAAPHFAGAVAVMKSAYPYISFDEMIAALKGGKILDNANNLQVPKLAMPVPPADDGGDETVETAPEIPVEEPPTPPVAETREPDPETQPTPQQPVGAVPIGGDAVPGDGVTDDGGTISIIQ